MLLIINLRRLWSMSSWPIRSSRVFQQPLTRSRSLFLSCRFYIFWFFDWPSSSRPWRYLTDLFCPSWPIFPPACCYDIRPCQQRQQVFLKRSTCVISRVKQPFCDSFWDSGETTVHTNDASTFFILTVRSCGTDWRMTRPSGLLLLLLFLWKSKLVAKLVIAMTVNGA